MTTINGWEYLTEIHPGNILSQSLQTEYNDAYNEAYSIFLSLLLVPAPEEIKENAGDSNKIKYIIYCGGDSDIIELEKEYHVKFLKSRFINNKSKRLKNDLIKYYKPHGFYVKGPYEIFIDGSSSNSFCLELCW